MPGGKRMAPLSKHPLLTAVVSIVAIASQAYISPCPQSICSTVLLKSDHSWDGVKYLSYPTGDPELTVLKLVIPPHTILPWHIHPMPNAAYVISGTLSVESKNGRDHATVHAGDVLPETMNEQHRGCTGDTSAELIVFYAGAKGVPTVVRSP
jgi:quercetin dioxygenase-like cupin family protein